MPQKFFTPELMQMHKARSEKRVLQPAMREFIRKCQRASTFEEVLKLVLEVIREQFASGGSAQMVMPLYMRSERLADDDFLDKQKNLQATQKLTKRVKAELSKIVDCKFDVSVNMGSFDPDYPKEGDATHVFLKLHPPL